MNSVHIIYDVQKWVKPLGRERQQRQAETTRTALLDAAARIAAQEGLDALTIRRLAGEMSYAPGTVYRYFKNKDAILHELCGEVEDQLRQRIESSLAPDEGFERTLRAVFGAVFELALDTPDRYALFVADRRRCGADSDKWLALLERAVRRGIDRGELRPADPALTARALWCSYLGVHQYVSTRGRSPGDKAAAWALAARHTDLLLDGLRRPADDEGQGETKR